MSKATQEKYKKTDGYRNGRKDSFILIAKIKGHETWRVINSSREIADLVKIVGEMKTVTEHRFMKMDGMTGKIEAGR